MIPFWAWSWLLTVIGIAGLLLAGSKRKVGWAVGIAAQGLWVAYALATEQYGFLASAAAYGSVYTRNFLRWRREEATSVPVRQVRPEVIYRGGKPPPRQPPPPVVQASPPRSRSERTRSREHFGD